MLAILRASNLEQEWSAILPDVRPIRKPFGAIAPLCLGLMLFVANNLAPLAAFLYPPSGYVPTLVPRGQDTALHLAWIEAFKNNWSIPNYHAPWETEPALHIPLMWITAKLSTLTHMSALHAYRTLKAVSYVLAIYFLAFLLRVFTSSLKQVILAVSFMSCALPLRSFLMIPAFVLKPTHAAVLAVVRV